MNSDNKVRTLVVDTTAFINNAPLQDIADEIVTVRAVVDEIKNKRQLRRLFVLPYDLRIEAPFPENVRAVTDFSKKTGDYPSLSAADLQVLALTLQLEKLHVGTDHLRSEPPCAPTLRAQPEPQPRSDSDPDDDWITPDNVREVKARLDGGTPDADADDRARPTVACITTDFAMQNVLKQMGLTVTALDGRVIRQLRTFILRCHTCFKTTALVDKTFCPKCGNATLKKVAVSVDERGRQVVHVNTRRPLTARGKRFSLPRPQGGKHARNPIIVEGQPTPQQRVSRRALAKNDPLHADVVPGFSPFAVRDVDSRSALLGLRPEGGRRSARNPNANNRRSK